MTFDVVVVGAGHNGLALATLLSGAGLHTAVVDRSTTAGGLATTVEPFPGFLHNPHANYLSYQDVWPEQIALPGLRTVVPRAQHGVAFEDGRPGVVLHRPDLGDHTHAGLARFSRSDADTYREIKRRADTLTSAVRTVLHRPADQDSLGAHAAAVSAEFDNLLGPLGSRTAGDLIDDLFDTPDLRLLLRLVTVELGGDLGEPGSDLSFMGFTLWMIGRRALPVGGMRSFAAALTQSAIDAGVHVQLSTTVEACEFAGNRVAGVRTRDSEVLLARRAVASTLPLESTLVDMVGAEHLSASDRSALATFRRASATTIVSQAYALPRAPHYSSADSQPDLDECHQVFVGYEDVADLDEHGDDLASGLFPRPRGAVRVNSRWDSTQAPVGWHIGASDAHFPDSRTLTEGDWTDLADGFPAAFAEVWRRASPGLVVAATRFSGHQDVDRKILTRWGAAQYRTTIPGLYLAGTATYPGGGIHASCAVNAAQVILRDLGESLQLS